MKTTIITSKGTTTIPKEFRDQLGLSPGSKVNFRRDNQRIYIERALSLEEVRALNAKHIPNELLQMSPEKMKKKVDQIRSRELKEKYGL